MKAESAKILEKAGDFAGIEVQIRDDYSGRGMYGNTTTAVFVEDDVELLMVVAGAVAQEEGQDVFETLCEDVRTMRRDNMGRSGIVLY